MRYDIFYYSATTGKLLNGCDFDVSQPYVDRLAPADGTLTLVIDSDHGKYWLDERGMIVETPEVVLAARAAKVGGPPVTKTADTFQARPEALRLGAGLSTHELARRSGVSQANVSRYETGDRRPSWDAVCRIADALCVDVAEFRNGRK